MSCRCGLRRANIATFYRSARDTGSTRRGWKDSAGRLKSRLLIAKSICIDSTSKTRVREDAILFTLQFVIDSRKLDFAICSSELTRPVTLSEQYCVKTDFA